MRILNRFIHRAPSRTPLFVRKDERNIVLSSLKKLNASKQRALARAYDNDNENDMLTLLSDIDIVLISIKTSEIKDFTGTPVPLCPTQSLLKPSKKAYCMLDNGNILIPEHEAKSIDELMLIDMLKSSPADQETRNELFKTGYYYLENYLRINYSNKIRPNTNIDGLIKEFIDDFRHGKLTKEEHVNLFKYMKEHRSVVILLNAIIKGEYELL